MSQSDKPSVENCPHIAACQAMEACAGLCYAKAISAQPSANGLVELVKYRLPHATDKTLIDIRAYAERLAALAGPLEQPQEPKSDQANLAQAFGGDDLQTALPRWIPMSERLPEEDCSVLGATWTDMTGVQQVEVVSFRRGTGQFRQNLTTVTHWMPLPLPPGESAGAVQSDKPAASSESSVSVPKEQQ